MIANIIIISLGNSSFDIPNSSNLKFVNGSTIEYLNINITDNTMCEADKKFNISIDNISDFHCSVLPDFERKYASVTIEDDDCGKLFYQSIKYSIYVHTYVYTYTNYVHMYVLANLLFKSKMHLASKNYIVY